MFWQEEVAAVGKGWGSAYVVTVTAAGLTVTAAAAALGVSRPALSSLLNGKAGLSGERSLRIEKAFGVRMDTLMRMQSAYEIAETRKREKLIRVGRVLRAA